MWDYNKYFEITKERIESYSLATTLCYENTEACDLFEEKI